MYCKLFCLFYAHTLLSYYSNGDQIFEVRLSSGWNRHKRCKYFVNRFCNNKFTSLGNAIDTDFIVKYLYSFIQKL